MTRDVTAREQRLAPPAGPAENNFTIEIRLNCPDDKRHHVGTLHTSSGSGWHMRLEPSAVSRYVKGSTDPAAVPPTTDTIFDYLEDDAVQSVRGAAEPPSSEDAEQRTVATSVLRWEPTPSGEQRLRWECCHCSMDRRRRARPDNILKGIRLARLVRLMRDHGPSRLAVELSAAGLDEAARDLLQHASVAGPNDR